MNKRSLLTLLCSLSCLLVFSQTGVDTIHFRKIYYFGGTGLAFPIGKTNRVLSPKLFTSSLGLDISLKNPSYYLQPTLYLFSFGYDQLENDQSYNSVLKNARANMYIMSLAGGYRKQWNRLNTYAYVGPSGALNVEPRAKKNLENDQVDLDYLYSVSPAFKIGLGSDYKFKGFFLGMELGYLHNFRQMQGNPVNVISLMFGLKSDITKLSDKVIDVITKD